MSQARRSEIEHDSIVRVCIVQNVLPLYAIAFFNRIVEIYPAVKLVVLADLQSSDGLNQYQPNLCQFEVRQLDSLQRAGVTLRPGIFRVLREVAADLVVFSASPREWSQMLVMLWFRLGQRPFAAWGMFHRIGGPRLFTKTYFRLIGLLANKCLTYTRIGAAHLVGIGVPKMRVAVVGTAIDERIPFAESALRTPAEMLEFRRRHGLENKQVVLQVVRLTHVKRPELLIFAVKRLLMVRDDVVVALVGDGPMKNELQTLAASLGIVKHIMFLGAIYDEEVLSHWYHCASAFVVPTFLGLSAHHAMSYGVPVITDDSLDSQGSEFEIVADGLNALTYREGDSDDLAQVLLRILSDTELQAFLSRNARKTIELTHNLERKTCRFVEFCASILGRELQAQRCLPAVASHQSTRTQAENAL